MRFVMPNSNVTDPGTEALPPDSSTEDENQVNSAGGSLAALWGPPAQKTEPTAAGAADPTGDGDDWDPATEALIRFADISEKDVRRARRVQGRLENPKPLGEVLVDLGTITPEQLESAQARRRQQMSLAEILREGGHLSARELEVYHAEKLKKPTPSDRQALVDTGLVSEEHYLEAVCARLGVPFVDPRIGEIETDLIDRIPFAYLQKNLILPVREEDGKAVVIVARPEDERLILEVERTFGMGVIPQCSTGARIAEALATLERIKGSPADRDAFKIQYRELDRTGEATDSTGEEAIQLVDYLLSRAVQLDASDLHIEPMMDAIRVRVRVDGVLQHLTDIPVDFGARLTARVKILARADVTEKRLHQDGKIHVKVEGHEIDIRVSTYISTFGETIVMRLLNRDRSIVPVAELGFEPRMKATLTESVLKASSGMVLMVGPTGSGKTTTLYSFVEHENDPSKKVITCEDPVEYVMDGVIQCSVNAKTGPTFSDSLRAIVRQDPDTIIVGEIRDEATAALAVEAALTGHKVFSTFHTEEAVGAFVRLLEMGVEPFLVASTITAVVAQRLARRLCEECKAPERPRRAELRFLGLDRSELGGVQLAGPTGCRSCNGTGYRGRLAIHEVLVPTDEFRQAVLDRGSTSQLRELARKMPEFVTLQEDGILKAVSGRTSLKEIIENAPRDTAPRPLSDLRRIANSRRGS